MERPNKEPENAAFAVGCRHSLSNEDRKGFPYHACFWHGPQHVAAELMESYQTKLAAY